MQWTAIRTADKVHLFGLHEGGDRTARVYATLHLNRNVDQSECVELTEEEADLLPDGELKSLGGGNFVRVIDRDDSAPWARVFTAADKEAALRIGLLALGKKSPEVEGRESVLSSQNRHFREEFEALGSALCCSRERVLERAQECREAELLTMGLKQQMAIMQDAIDAMTSEQERLKRTVATLAQTAVDIAIDRRRPSELKISDVE